MRVSNIVRVRCDGFVEYAYESNGQIIRGSDISTYQGVINDNMNSAIYTPKHQAGCLTKVGV